MRVASGMDVPFAIAVLKYYAGWADKITGQTLEVGKICAAYFMRRGMLTTMDHEFL